MNFKHFVLEECLFCVDVGKVTTVESLSRWNPRSVWNTSLKSILAHNDPEAIDVWPLEPVTPPYRLGSASEVKFSYNWPMRRPRVYRVHMSWETTLMRNICLERPLQSSERPHVLRDHSKETTCLETTLMRDHLYWDINLMRPPVLRDLLVRNNLSMETTWMTCLGRSFKVPTCLGRL